MINRRKFLSLTSGSLGFALLAQVAHSGGHNGFCVYRDTQGGAYLPDRNMLVMGNRSSVHVTQVPQGKPATVLAETNSQYVEAMKYRRGGVIPPDSTVFFDRSNQPELITDRLDEPLSGVRVFHNFPRNEDEFRLVHPEVAAAFMPRRLAAYRKLGEILEANGATAVSSMPSGRAKALEEAIQATRTDELVVIISHVPRQERLAGTFLSSYRSALITLTDGTTFDAIRNLEASGSSVPGNEILRDGFPNFTAGDLAERLLPGYSRRTSWLIGCQTWDLFIGRPDLINGSLAVTRPLTFQQGASAGMRLNGSRTLRDAANRLVIPRRAQPQETPSENLGVDHPEPAPIQAPFAILAEVAPEQTITSFETVSIA